MTFQLFNIIINYNINRWYDIPCTTYTSRKNDYNVIASKYSYRYIGFNMNFYLGTKLKKLPINVKINCRKQVPI